MNKATDMPDQLALGRLRWRCRRGMLELDLLFVDFVEQHLASLNEAELVALNGLLDMADQQLWKLVSVSDDEVDPTSRQVLAKLRGESA